MCSCTARTCQLMLGTKHTALFPLVSISLPAAVACLGRGLLFGGSSAGSLGLTARCSGLSPLSEGLPCRPQGHCVSSACSSSPRGWPSMLSSGSSSPCGWPSMSSSGSALPPPGLVECLRSHCLPLSHVPARFCLLWLPPSSSRRSFLSSSGAVEVVGLLRLFLSFCFCRSLLRIFHAFLSIPATLLR